MRGGSIPQQLQLGTYVVQGQIIGRTGSTGYTCSLLFPICTVPDPHVHFEVRKNGITIPIEFEDCYYHGNQCVNGAPIAYRYLYIDQYKSLFF